MEQSPGSNSQHRSLILVILAAVVLPPLGLILLWMRNDTEPGKKVFGSVGIIALAAVYGFLFFGRGVFVAQPDPSSEAHYAELERQRAAQREAAVANAPAADPATQAIAAAPANSNESKPAAASAKSTRSYWTNFRGPARDGRYDEAPIRTNWPASGLPLLWKQPIGGGYASFVVAEGMAFTIEQRRNQEIVAAYDVETGREIWTHGWDAEFKESMGGDGPRATPTWEAGRLWSLGAEGDLICFEAKTG